LSAPVHTARCLVDRILSPRLLGWALGLCVLEAAHYARVLRDALSRGEEPWASRPHSFLCSGWKGARPTRPRIGLKVARCFSPRSVCSHKFQSKLRLKHAATHSALVTSRRRTGHLTSSYFLACSAIIVRLFLSFHLRRSVRLPV